MPQIKKYFQFVAHALEEFIHGQARPVHESVAREALLIKSRIVLNVDVAEVLEWRMC